MRASKILFSAAALSFSISAFATVSVSSDNQYAFEVSGAEAQTLYQELSKVAAGAVSSGAPVNFGRLSCSEESMDFQQPGCSVQISLSSSASLNQSTIQPIYNNLLNAYFQVHGEASVGGISRGSCGVVDGTTQCTLFFQPNGGAA